MLILTLSALTAPEQGYYFVLTHKACTTAGNQSKKHKMILMMRSLPAPALRNTATGGSKIDNMISISLLSKAKILFLMGTK